MDWSQNDSHKTTVCVYSLRAKERPTASTPVTWEEVKSALRKREPARLTFQPDEFWDGLTKDARIVRNGAKILSVRDNAAFVQDIAR